MPSPSTMSMTMSKGGHSLPWTVRAQLEGCHEVLTSSQLPAGDMMAVTPAKISENPVYHQGGPDKHTFSRNLIYIIYICIYLSIYLSIYTVYRFINTHHCSTCNPNFEALERALEWRHALLLLGHSVGLEPWNTRLGGEENVGKTHGETWGKRGNDGKTMGISGEYLEKTRKSKFLSFR